MMYGYGHMFGWGGPSIFGFLCTATWLVWLAAGILLAIYLWKKISKE